MLKHSHSNTPSRNSSSMLKHSHSNMPSRNNSRLSSRTTTIITSSNSKLLGSTASSNRHSTRKNSSVSSRPHGRDIDQKTGSQTTARGSNVVDITATASLTTGTTDTLARTTRS